MRNKLSKSELKRNVKYNSKTGHFTRKIAHGGSKIGDIAGCKKDGYIEISINDISYYAHRLAWLYVHGYFPEYGVDHKDRIKHHNWIDNLRESTQQCNTRNTGNFKHNKSGVKGVYAKGEKWIAQIKVNKKGYGLGTFTDFDEAVCTRLCAEQCLDWANCDSNSPAYLHVQKMLGGTI